MTTTFTRTGPDGQVQTRTAHTPAEAVHLRYHGWREDKPARKPPRAEPEPTKPDKTNP